MEYDEVNVEFKRKKCGINVKSEPVKLVTAVSGQSVIFGAEHGAAVDCFMFFYLTKRLQIAIIYLWKYEKGSGYCRWKPTNCII